MKPSLKVLTIGFLILLLATVLRFANLGSFPIFADESIYIRWSQVMRVEPSLRFLPLSDGKQPLYMWATIPFLKLISDPLVAARTFSALSGIGTLLGIALMAQMLFKNSRLTLLASVLWAVIPFAVFFNRLALADSLLAMFMVWGFDLMYISFSKLRLDFAMLAGFAFGFAWLTKSPALFALILLPSLLIFLPKLTWKNFLVSCLLFLATFTISFGMYNILRLGPEFHMIALRNADYVFSFSDILKHPSDPLIPHLKDSIEFYFYLVTPVGLLFLFWGMLGGRFSHWKSRCVTSLWLLCPIIAQSLIAKAFTARYIFFTVPFAVVLISHGLEHLGQRTQKHLLVFVGVLLLILPSIWIDYLLISKPASVALPRIEREGYLEGWTSGYGLKEVADSLRNFAKSGPVLIGSEGFFGTPFNALQLYLNDVPNVRVIGIGTSISSIDQKLITAQKDNQVFVVVNSTRFFIPDPQSLGLKLLGSYPKATSPIGQREYLLFFQLNTGK